MRYFIYLLSIFLFLVLNLGLLTLLPLFGQIPNLLFLFVLCSALGKKEYDFMFIALVSGILLDFFSPLFFGGFTFAFLSIALAVYLFSNFVFAIELSFRTLGISTVFAWVALNLIVWLWQLTSFKLGLSPYYVNFGVTAQGLLTGLVYNLLLLYPMYVVYDYLMHKLQNYEVRSRGVVK